MMIYKKEDKTKPSLERRLEIINLVGVKGKVHVDELSEYYNVTGATIRTDLRFLEQQGYLVRAHGYAMVNRTVIAKLAESQKKAQLPHNTFDCCNFIATSIYNSLDDKSTVFIDSSPLIRDSFRSLNSLKGSTIITHDLQLIQKFPQIETGNVFITGGKLEIDEMKLTGSSMINSLKQYRFNNAFIHVDSFNVKLGLFAKSEFDSDLIRLLCDLSEKITIVAKASIFKSNDPFWICDASSIDTLIIDGELSYETIKFLKRNNINIVNKK